MNWYKKSSDSSAVHSDNQDLEESHNEPKSKSENDPVGNGAVWNKAPGGVEEVQSSSPPPPMSQSTAAGIFYKFLVDNFQTPNGNLAGVVQYFSMFVGLVESAVRKIEANVPVGTIGWTETQAMNFLKTYMGVENLMGKYGISFDLATTAKPEIRQDAEKLSDDDFSNKYGFKFEQYDIILRALASLEYRKKMISDIRSSILEYRKKTQKNLRRYRVCTPDKKDVDVVKERVYERTRSHVIFNVTFDKNDVPLYCCVFRASDDQILSLKASMPLLEFVDILREESLIVSEMEDKMHLAEPKRKQLLKALYGVLRPNLYFEDIPIAQIKAALKSLDFYVIDEDGTDWSGFFAGDDGRGDFDLAYRAAGQKGWHVDNAKLHMTWHKMPSGRYEIVGYIS